MDKYCPLLLAAYITKDAFLPYYNTDITYGLFCLKENCAWWDDQRCAILNLASLAFPAKEEVTSD